MGKFAKKPPKTVKSIVEIEGTKDHAEAWYSRPQMLGRIDQRAGRWYTQDGKRFISSHDALEYLITMHEMVGPDRVTAQEKRAIPIPPLLEPEPIAATPIPTAPPAPSRPVKRPPSAERGRGNSSSNSNSRGNSNGRQLSKQQQSQLKPQDIDSVLKDLLKRPDFLTMLAKEAAQKKG